MALGRTAKFVRSVAPVVFLSLAALILALFGSRIAVNWEPAIYDQFMRWRHYLAPAPVENVHPDIVAVGIDASAQERFGRFGAGMWLTRQPFVDQLGYLNDYLKPSVIAYDIIFEEPLGRVSRKNMVTESAERLALLSEHISSIKANPGLLIHPVILDYMNRLASEQGTSWLVHTMAGSSAEIVMGYYYRGGWMDPQPSAVDSWTREDVEGDGDGDGVRIPYLKDVRIPEKDIHFSEAGQSELYLYAPNAKFPVQGMLDYGLLGFVNCPRDIDSVVRRVPLVAGFSYNDAGTGEVRSAFTPSFALLPYLIHAGITFPLEEGVVQVFFGRHILIKRPDGRVLQIPVDELGSLTLNYDAAFDDFRAVNFVDTALPSGSRDEFKQTHAASIRSRFEGRIVVVGVTSGQDSGPTPLSAKTPLMHVHLTALNNMLTANFLVETSGSERVIIYLAVWLLVTLVCCVEKTARLGPTTLLLAAGYGVFSFVMLYAGIRIVPVITPVFFVVLSAFSVMTYRFLTEERAKKKIRGMFSTMVSDRVLDYLEQNPESFSLKGHRADVTVLFSDVGGFTSISETLAPERLTALLNRYFNMVTDCIMSSGGYLDKYVGDGVMAVWGAPFPDAEHALKACQSAMEQVRMLKELNKELQAEFGIELSMRIGMNSGAAIAGNMGSSRKFQYTVMGDTVNLAARLEPSNKDFGTAVIIGQATREQVKHIMATRLLARIIVKGKTEAVAIYELIGEKSAVSGEDREVYALYDEAMAGFNDRDWVRARKALDSLFSLRASDGPALFLQKQLVLMRENPPPAGWQGEYVRKEKD